MITESLRTCLKDSNAWPVQEARNLLDRIEKLEKTGNPVEKVTFETGYGPSGLPHIGTFGEVARTSMVRHAFQQLSDLPTELIAFSDDMDGMRKVPDTIPNPSEYKQYTAIKSDDPNAAHPVGGVRLTAIPDPFGTHESFGHNMNARLCAFLDQFGFDYTFKSATSCYQGGEFNDTLLAIARHHEDICNIVRPMLSEGRRAHYSPFLPVDPETQRTLHVTVEIVDAGAGIIRYQNPLKENSWVETPVTDGHTKLQWRADWAMRWVALGVDYEMYGKDLTPSAQLSGKIARVIGGQPPAGFAYELFLDEKGQKISKSKGNGLTIDEWLRYAPPESLSLYMFQAPRKSKRLYFDVIPRQVDDYLTFLQKYPEQEPEAQLANPVWHIHEGAPPAIESPLSFSLLLNLASACNPEDASVLWGFIQRYSPGTTPENSPMLSRLADYAVQYYRDFVRPAKQYRLPTEAEQAAIRDVTEALAALPEQAEADTIQQLFYDIGKAHRFELKDWFRALYEILLGASQGPRIGSFVALYGTQETRNLIEKALKGEDLAA